jgi:hypothetical protein
LQWRGRVVYTLNADYAARTASVFFADGEVFSRKFLPASLLLI